MPHPFQQQRVAVLVDTANLYHAARARGLGRVDYARLLERLVGGRALTRAVAFVLRGEEVDVTPFTDALAASGFEIRLKTLKRRADGLPRGDWGVGIAVAAMSLAPKIDALVLASGDGGLAELPPALKALGVRVEIAAFEGGLARALREEADALHLIGEGHLLR